MPTVQFQLQLQFSRLDLQATQTETKKKRERERGSTLHRSSRVLGGEPSRAVLRASTGLYLNVEWKKQLEILDKYQRNEGSRAKWNFGGFTVWASFRSFEICVRFGRLWPLRYRLPHVPLPFSLSLTSIWEFLTWQSEKDQRNRKWCVRWLTVSVFFLLQLTVSFLCNLHSPTSIPTKKIIIIIIYRCVSRATALFGLCRLEVANGPARLI